MTPFDSVYSKQVQGLCSNYFTISMTRWLTPLKDLKSIYEFIKFCIRTRNDYDVVHTMTLKPNVLLAPLIFLLYPSKVIRLGLVSGLGDFLYFHLCNESFKSVIIRFVLRVSFRVFRRVWVQNPDDINLLVEKKILTQKQAVLGYGSGIEPISKDFFDSLMNQKIKRITESKPSTKYILMCVARAIENKGVLDFVKAIEIFNQSIDSGLDVKFILVAPPEDNGVNCIEGVTLPANLELISTWITSDAVDNLVQDSYFVCLPSYYPEGVPRFLLEGLRFGVPVITTNTAGCKEAVIQDFNGYVVEPQNPLQLADAFRRAATLSLNDYQAYSQNALDLANRKFSTEALWTKLNKYLYS